MLFLFEMFTTDTFLSEIWITLIFLKAAKILKARKLLYISKIMSGHSDDPMLIISDDESALDTQDESSIENSR